MQGDRLVHDIGALPWEALPEQVIPSRSGALQFEGFRSCAMLGQPQVMHDGREE